MDRNADFGGFLGQAIDLVTTNSRASLLFIAVVGGFNAFGLMMGLIDGNDSIAGIGFGFSIDASEGITAALYHLATAALSIVASYFLLMVLLASCGRLRDRSTRIWAYIGMSILTVLGAVLGMLLLIVPGIILLVRWSAASGFLIGERAGVTESLGQSWEATRGYSWPIFFAFLVLIVGFIVIAGVIGGVAGFIGSDLIIAIASSAAEAAGSVLSLAFGIGVFTLLHDDSQQVSEVFS